MVEGLWVGLFQMPASFWVLHGWHLGTELGWSGLGSYQTYEVGWGAPPMDGVETLHWVG